MSAAQADATPQSKSTGANLAIAMSVFFVVLCIASAIAWFVADIADLRDAVESTEVNQQTLDDTGQTREEFNDFMETAVRVISGGLQLVTASMFGLFGFMASRLRPSGRVGLMVLALLGVFGSFLMLSISGVAVFASLVGSAVLLGASLSPGFRSDIRNGPHGPLAQVMADQASARQYAQQPGYHPVAPPPHAPSHNAPPPNAQPPHVPSPAPWASSGGVVDPEPAPARVAPSGAGIPEPPGPGPTHDSRWDPVRGVYTRWDPALSVWVWHDPTSGEWRPLD